MLMLIPPLFWNYNNEQHEYAIKVLLQREQLAKEGYVPAEYDGGLDFDKPEKIKDGIPANAKDILEKLKETETAEVNK